MKEHYDKYAYRWLENASDEEVLTAAGVPSRLVRGALGHSHKPLPKQARFWVDHLDDIHKPQGELDPATVDLAGTGLILYGESGVGKSVMAAQMLLDLIRSGRHHWVDDSAKSRLYVPMLGRFFDWQELSEHLRQQFSEPAQEWEMLEDCLYGCGRRGLSGVSGPFFGGGVVVIDDISRERQTEFNQDRLHHYLRKRNNDCLLTVLTTNFDPDEWSSVYGPVLGAFMHRAFISAEVS